MIKTKFFPSFALVAIVAMPALSFAGEGTKSCCSKASAAPEKLNESVISGDLGLNVVSSYITVGAVRTNHAPSFQPYFDIFFKAYQGDGLINRASVSISALQTFSNTGAGVRVPSSTTHTWVESDFAPGIQLTSGKFTLMENYVFHFFPSDLLPTAQALASRLCFDDSEHLGAFALHPTFAHLKELEGKFGAASTKKGNYWELTATPGTAVGPVSVTLPLTLGFGSNGFYASNGYGFFSAGLNFGYVLPVAKTYGTWRATTGVTYYNSDKQATGNKSSNDLVVSGGIGVSF